MQRSQAHQVQRIPSERRALMLQAMPYSPSVTEPPSAHAGKRVRPVCVCVSTSASPSAPCCSTSALSVAVHHPVPQEAVPAVALAAVWETFSDPITLSYGA